MSRVSAELIMLARTPATRPAERVASALLLCLMALGSLALWIAVPAGCLWVSSKIAATSAEEFLLALPMTALGMIAFGAFLVWLNRLYLRASGTIARYEAEEEELPGSAPRFLGGPLELILVGSLVIALAALFVWFFVFARNAPLVPL